ncbi:MAG: hypothetical protein NTZ65_01275 [Candidatus Berkelbacteria bacterium]|nr:hypothetical protein [Candidatus Berkelbacteria bacterium]
MAKDEENKKKGLSTGAWIAISCGGVLVLVILTIIVIGVAVGKSTTNTSSDTDSHGYPQDVKTSFVGNCQLSAIGKSFQGYCECSFDYIESKFSYDQFKQMSDEYEKTKTLPQGIAEAGASCVKQAPK